MQESGAAENHLRGSAFLYPDAPLRCPAAGAAESIPCRNPGAGRRICHPVHDGGLHRAAPVILPRANLAPMDGLPDRAGLTDRDQVGLCPGRHSPVALISCFGKNADAVPRRPRRLCQGTRASGCGHPVRDRPSRRIHPARAAFRGRLHWMFAIVTTGRDADGERQGVRILGRSAAAGEGTASAFFGERDDGGGGGGCLSWHIIHLIAIGCACARGGTR
jgi:hypothetical protein